jgi:beta-glucosidase
LWLSKRGGFERSDTPAIFARYARFIAKELGNEIESLTTINEPVVFAGLGWLKGNWPPFKQFSWVSSKNEMTLSGDRALAKPTVRFSNVFTYWRVLRHLVEAHNLAYDAIKQERPQMDVGLVQHVVAYQSNWNPFNMLRAWVQDNFMNHSFLRKVYKKCDSFGLNFYHYVKFGDPHVYKKTDMGWDMTPEGIYYALKTLWRYRKPIVISEAGLADADDSDRAEYIKKQVAATWQAIQDGVDVRGHMYWSLLDNYELALGYEKRFGLVEINYETLARIIRPSAYVYKQICETNAVVE